MRQNTLDDEALAWHHSPEQHADYARAYRDIEIGRFVRTLTTLSAPLVTLSRAVERAIGAMQELRQIIAAGDATDFDPGDL